MSEDCPHCVFEKTEANCRGCFEWSNFRPKPITNADRIRSMDDDELVDELLELFACFTAVEWSRDMILNWLKKEVKT